MQAFRLLQYQQTALSGTREPQDHTPRVAARHPMNMGVTILSSDPEFALPTLVSIDDNRTMSRTRRPGDPAGETKTAREPKTEKRGGNDNVPSTLPWLAGVVLAVALAAVPAGADDLKGRNRADRKIAGGDRDQSRRRRVLVQQDRSWRLCRRAGRSRQGDGGATRCSRRICRLPEFRANHRCRRPRAPGTLRSCRRTPERETKMGFGPIYEVADATYIVKAGSAITNFATLDQPGVKVAAEYNTTTMRGAVAHLKNAKVIGLSDLRRDLRLAEERRDRRLRAVARPA